MYATIRNDFHNTEYAVRVSADIAGGGYELTSQQVANCRSALCGIAGCTCGGDLSERGPQDYGIVTFGYDHVTGTPRIKLIAKE